VRTTQSGDDECNALLERFGIDLFDGGARRSFWWFSGSQFMVSRARVTSHARLDTMRAMYEYAEAELKETDLYSRPNYIFACTGELVFPYLFQFEHVDVPGLVISYIRETRPEDVAITAGGDFMSNVVTRSSAKGERVNASLSFSRVLDIVARLPDEIMRWFPPDTEIYTTKDWSWTQVLHRPTRTGILCNSSFSIAGRDGSMCHFNPNEGVLIIPPRVADEFILARLSEHSKIRAVSEAAAEPHDV